MNKKNKTLLLCSILLSLNTICSAESPMLDQAYSLALSGDLQASNKLYQKLLKDSHVPKYEVYFSRCLVDIARLDTIGSDNYYSLATKELEKTPDNDGILLEFNYKRAALLINKGEYGKAIMVLTPYVFKQNASVRMQSDYLDANYRLGNYQQVIKAAALFWHEDYTNKPLYGIMSVADSLFRLKKYAQAERVYAIILQSSPDNFFANLSSAYCLGMLGQDSQALDIYARSYSLHPAATDLILNEANTLFAQGKTKLANNIYEMLKTKNPDKKKQINLANAITLGNNGYILSSNKLLASLPDTDSREYWLQRFTNYMQEELYANAADVIKKVENTPLHNLLRNRYKAARKGGIGTIFSTTDNYKGNSVQSYSVEGDVYIGFNTYLTASLGNYRFSNQAQTTTVTTTTLGLKHHFELGQLYASVSNANSGSAHTLYDLGFDYKLDDLTTVSILTGLRNIEFVQAIQNGFVTEKYYTLALARKINNRHSLFFDYTTSSLSDTNHFFGYGISYSYLPVKTPTKTHEFFAYYRRSGFNKQSELYETPDKRIAYGAGWQGRWTQTNLSYWLVRTTLELGYDNLDPTDTSPNIRVQYTFPIADKQEISVATEYGLRTNRLGNLNRFVHGYKLLELRYNLSF